MTAAWENKPANYPQWYTQSSVDALENYYATIDMGLTAQDQATVDGYAAELISLTNALELKPADYAIVDAAIIAIPDNDGGLLAVDYDYLATMYTGTSIANLQAAIAAVDTSKKINQQGTVDGYAAAIEAATSALEILSADYSGLETQLGTATAWPESYYTTGSWGDYSSAMSAGQTMLNAHNLSIQQQATVDTAADLIATNRGNLVLKPVSYTVKYVDGSAASLAADKNGSSTAATLVTENAIEISDYTPRLASIQQTMTGTNADNVITFIYDMSSVTVTFDANGGTGGTSGSMTVGATLTPPTVTKTGYTFTGWSPSVPATVQAGGGTYVAQWTREPVTATQGQTGVEINIKGWSADSSYQIWTRQKVTGYSLLDTTANVQTEQWILSQAYTLGSEGEVQPDGSIKFVIPNFVSPEENYTIAVRVVDSSENFVAEIRNSFTPAQLGIAVISKVLVDEAVSKATEIKEIKTGATVGLQVIGNDVGDIVYTAKIVNAGSEIGDLTFTGNQASWDISALAPGNYDVEITASSALTATEDKVTVRFSLYSLDPNLTYGLLSDMTVSYENGQLIVTPTFSGGRFAYVLREPRGSVLYSSPATTVSGQPMTPYATTLYGRYFVNGYVLRDGLSGNEQFNDDSMSKVLYIGRGGATPTVALTASENIREPITKNTVTVTFTAAATIEGVAPENILYSFWRHDATGIHLVRDWGASNTLDWKPARIGDYVIEVRAKGNTGTGSYEAERQVAVMVTAPGEVKAQVTAININLAELNANAEAHKPIIIKANTTPADERVLYRFDVYDADAWWKGLKWYSPDQECLWIPRKAGNYKIRVAVKSSDSYGVADITQVFDVTVQ